MVGVAGKSQGCATCRARKKRCDLRRPSCANCATARRVCGGYERYSVFLNRTPSGLERRRRLEEVRPLTGSSAAQSRSTEPVPVPVSIPNGQCDDEQPPQQQTTLWSPSWSEISSQLEIMQWYLGSFVFSPAGKRFSPCLVPIVSVASPGPLLQISLLSLSTQHLGATSKNPSALHCGQMRYGSALKQLQVALNDSQASLADETLASAILLGLYELMAERGLANKKSMWMKHLDGIESLLVHRGSKNCKTPVSWGIFEHCRKLIMLRSLLERKSSRLGSAEWLDAASTLNDPEHQLCNLGLKFCTMVKYCEDELRRWEPSVSRLKHLMNELETFIRLVDHRHSDCCDCSDLRLVLVGPATKTSESSPEMGMRSPAPLSSQEQTEDKHAKCAMLMAMQLICHTAATEAAARVLSSAGVPLAITHPTAEYRVKTRARLAESITRISAIYESRGTSSGRNVALMWWSSGIARQELAGRGAVGRVLQEKS